MKRKEVIHIRISPNLKKYLEKVVVHTKYPSTSAYVRDMIINNLAKTGIIDEAVIKDIKKKHTQEINKEKWKMQLHDFYLIRNTQKYLFEIGLSHMCNGGELDMSIMKKIIEDATRQHNCMGDESKELLKDQIILLQRFKNEEFLRNRLATSLGIIATKTKGLRLQ